jgi:hypothetical protein
MKNGGDGLRPGRPERVTRLRYALAPELRRRLESITRTLAASAGPSRNLNPKRAFLDLILDAVERDELVEIVYRKLESSRARTYTIEPHHLARDPELRELPVDHVPRRPCLVAGPQLHPVPKLLDDFPQAVEAVRDDTNAPDNPVRLRYGDRDRLRVDIKANPASRIPHDRLLSHVALRYASSRMAWRNLRLANPSRSFHSDQAVLNAERWG